MIVIASVEVTGFSISFLEHPSKCGSKNGRIIVLFLVLELYISILNKTITWYPRAVFSSIKVLVSSLPKYLLLV